jgi:hypothetical protein
MGVVVILAVVVASRIVAEKSKVVRYPLRALLGVSTAVDIDGSVAHMHGLFPTVSGKREGELRYDVPLSHPWFDEVQLSWENESAGKLTLVTFAPPADAKRFANQKEIADCLSRSLGAPEVEETDHLARENNYSWPGSKATAVLFPSFLWLKLQGPEGEPSVTLAQVVRTLDGCAPETAR